MTLGLSAAQAQRHFRTAISTRNIYTYVLANDPNIFVKESRVEYLQQGVASNRVRNSNGAVFAARHKKVGSQRKQGKRWFLSVMGHI